jgi:hypothetical protein
MLKRIDETAGDCGLGRGFRPGNVALVPPCGRVRRGLSPVRAGPGMPGWAACLPSPKIWPGPLAGP